MEKAGIKYMTSP